MIIEQKEVGGKQILLMAGLAKTASVTASSAAITVTAHGAKVGSILQFDEVSTNTTIETGKFYFVVAVPTANTLEIAEEAGGTAIVPDVTAASLKVDLYKSLGGLRSKSLSFSVDGVDITNQESDEWKVLLDGAGARSLSVSGSGVYTTESTFQAVKAAAINNKLMPLIFLNTKTFDITQAAFKITSIEESGDYDAESQYSISAESSGSVTYITAE